MSTPLSPLEFSLMQQIEKHLGQQASRILDLEARVTTLERELQRTSEVLDVLIPLLMPDASSSG